MAWFHTALLVACCFLSLFVPIALHYSRRARGAPLPIGAAINKDLLYNHQDKFRTFRNVSIFISTFNVHGRAPPEDIPKWLVFEAEKPPPDFVVIGLQEMDLSWSTYVWDNYFLEEQWLRTLKKSLPDKYQIVDKVRLIGIFMVIFRHTESSVPPHSIVHSSKLATGFWKFGNKGGVGISFDIDDTSVCFINSHLASGSELEKRNQDFHEISKMRFLNGKGVYDHDVVFWLGDLNYRLDSPLDYNGVLEVIESGEVQSLLEYDQLKKQQEAKQAFHGFKELMGVPFRPTYKYDVGTSRWDTSEKRRIPAWCDRILTWTQDETTKVLQNEYSSAEEVTFSDHKPVRAVFTLSSRIIDQKKKAKVYKEEVLRERNANDN